MFPIPCISSLRKSRDAFYGARLVDASVDSGAVEMGWVWFVAGWLTGSRGLGGHGLLA